MIWLTIDEKLQNPCASMGSFVRFHENKRMQG